MKAIASKDTSPELMIRRALFKKGFRYRIHYKDLPGKPDIVFVKKKVAIFCDGDFWHGKDWEQKKKKIKSNREYWIPKIQKNMQRDRISRNKLLNMGWTVLRFWDSDIKKNLDSVLNEILKHINASNNVRTRGKN